MAQLIASMRTVPRERFLRWALLGAAAAGVAFLVAAPFIFLPHEDAAILFQYSRNLAETGVIGYDPGGPRAEGATDFLWMLVLTVAPLLGFDSYLLTGVLNAACLIVAACVLVRIAGFEVTPQRASVPFLLLLLLPTLPAALAGFSVAAITLGLVATTWFMLEGRDRAFSLSCLVFCLFRPDGVVFVVPLMASRLIFANTKNDVLKNIALFFVVPGLIYFLARWSYFGEFLPLPFLVKSNINPVFGVFEARSLKALLDYAYWFAPLWIIGLLVNRERLSRNAALFTSLIAVPSVFYATIRLEQNVAERFFTYLYVGTFILVCFNYRTGAARRNATFLVAAILYIYNFAPITLEGYRQLNLYRQNNVFRIATALRDSGIRGRMLVTEAGILPYYSRWHVTDLWGLNTPRFAHRLIQPGDMRDLHGDLIVLNGAQHLNCMPPARPRTPHKARRWLGMVENVLMGIDISRYQILRVPLFISSIAAAKSGARARFDCYLLRKDFGEADRTREILFRFGAVRNDELKARPLL